jgi:ribosomal protein S18 acetylase RimI-like enzyme
MSMYLSSVEPMMIHQIHEDEWHQIAELVDEYLTGFTNDVDKREHMKQSLKTKMQNGDMLIIAGIDSNDRLYGFCTFETLTYSLTMLYTRDDEWRGFFEEVIAHLKREKPAVYIKAEFFPTHMYEAFIQNGFTEFHENGMSISREGIFKIPDTHFHSSYSLVSYTDDMEDMVSETMFRDNSSSSSIELYQEFFGSIEGCREVLTRINRIGRTFVLMHNDSPLGTCIYSIKENSGYINNIGIVPEYRNQGLGGFLLTSSMKRLLDETSSIDSVSLDVIIDEDNYAFKMYDKAGFSIDRSYSKFVWRRE